MTKDRNFFDERNEQKANSLLPVWYFAFELLFYPPVAIEVVDWIAQAMVD